LLTRGYLEKRKSSPREIADLFAVADRDLKDSAVAGLSADLSFATAYSAALRLAEIVLRATGYRTKGAAHHWSTIAALPLLMGKPAESRADYLDACRIKRNTAMYDRAGMIARGEADEAICEAKAFRTEVLEWLLKKHPTLAPQGKP
jgi:hypothetical protein